MIVQNSLQTYTCNSSQSPALLLLLLLLSMFFVLLNTLAFEYFFHAFEIPFRAFEWPPFVGVLDRAPDTHVRYFKRFQSPIFVESV